MNDFYIGQKVRFFLNQNWGEGQITQIFDGAVNIKLFNTCGKCRAGMIVSVLKYEIL